jgi:hypothetical protein
MENHQHVIDKDLGGEGKLTVLAAGLAAGLGLE